MVMRALMVREARRLLRWWLLSMAIVMAAWLREIIRINNGGDYILFIGERSQLLSVVGFALVAIGLGVAQAWPDALGARWVAYVHVPVSRARLFASKAIVGIAALLTITMGSTLAVALMVSMPGRLGAPFEWSMLRVPALDALAAVVYYLTALGVIFRPGRWLGSRLLPLGLPLLSTMLVLSAPGVGAALAVLALAIVIAAIGAWASFRVCDSGWSLPWSLRAVEGLHLAAGLLLGSLVVMGLGGWALDVSLVEYPRSAQAYYRIHDDGRVLIAQPGEEGMWEHRDLQGEKVDLDSSPSKQRALRADLRREERPYSGPRSLSDHRVGADEPHYRDMSAWVLHLNPRDGRGRSRWYYSYAQRRIVAYHNSSAQRLGSWSVAERLGPGEELLSVDSEGLFVTRSTLWRFDFNQERLDEVLRPEGGEIAAATESYGMYEHQGGRRVLVWAGDQLHVKTESGAAQTFSLSLLPPDTHYVALYGLSDGRTLLWGRPSYRSHEGGVVLRYADGKLSAAQSLPTLPRVGEQAPRPLVALALLTPPLLPALQGVLARWLPEPPKPIALGTPFLALLAAMALLCMAGCFMLARRQGLPLKAQLSWALSGAILGLVGPLLFRSMHAPQALFRCEHCRRQYPLTASSCTHCGKTSQPALRPSILTEAL